MAFQIDLLDPFLFIRLESKIIFYVGRDKAGSLRLCVF